MTISLVAGGVAFTDRAPEEHIVDFSASASAPQASASGNSAREARTSRAGARATTAAARAASRRAAAKATDSALAAGPLYGFLAAEDVRVDRSWWTTAPLDLRWAPAGSARVSGEVPAGKKVGATGVRRAGYAQIVYRGTVRWVTAAYLSARKPVSPAAMAVRGAPCPRTGSVERGLSAKAVAVHRAVCNNFPQLTRYLGWDGHGEHSSGRAIDIMISDASLGNAVAEFLRSHAAELGLYDIIWRQRIWTPVRAGEGWRSMPNRGSATANHYDHVHVSVY